MRTFGTDVIVSLQTDLELNDSLLSCYLVAKNIHSVLSMFNFKRFRYILCETLCMQCSSNVLAKDWHCSSDVLKDLYSWVSSAKKWNKTENSWINRAMGWAYREYARGPAPPPCGKPLDNSTFSERLPFTTTCCERSERYDDIHAFETVFICVKYKLEIDENPLF